MGIPLYKEFTEEQRQQFGPEREQYETLQTERHVYVTPFMYPNVDVGDFYEIDVSKGIELKADDGFITINEKNPIVAVTVVGSGCGMRGYNICEWWGEGETIDNMTNQLVKRQRIDNLNGTHPMIAYQIMMGTFPGLTYSDAFPEPVKDHAECMKRLSNGYYGSLCLALYENTAHFCVGPPYPNKVTIRGGCKEQEIPGFPDWDEYPAHYAFRVIDVTVIK